MYKKIKSPFQRIRSLRQNQYIFDFHVRDRVLICDELSEIFYPFEITIENSERFERDCNPENKSMMYVLRTHSGIRGILLEEFGKYYNPEIREFIKKISIN